MHIHAILRSLIQDTTYSAGQDTFILQVTFTI